MTMSCDSPVSKVRPDSAVSRGQPSRMQRSKSHGFESRRSYQVLAYGRRYVQVRPVRPKINHLKKIHIAFRPFVCRSPFERTTQALIRV